MVTVLCVSRSGYHAWRKQRGTVSAKRAQQITRDKAVKTLFYQQRKRAGAAPIHAALKAQGIPCDIKTVSASLRRQGLVAKGTRKFKVTTDSVHTHYISPNRLNRDITAEKPNQKWVGDITYLYTSEGWLYLAVIIDLYSRQVVGWSMDKRMKSDLVCRALQMAIRRRGITPSNCDGLILHSDRGSQYCAKAYRKIISHYGFVQSMSRKGNCWDNACAESFFRTLKVEAVYSESLLNRYAMKRMIFQYIEVYYNRQRLHGSIGWQTPVNYEAKYVQISTI